MRYRLLCCLLLACGLLRPQPAPDFDSTIKPILVSRCAQCHGGDSTLSGFDLTTQAGLRAGGTHGVAVTPGDPDGSRLYQWVATGKMPMGKKLLQQEIDALRAWIAAGARWGSEERIVRPRAGRDWWAFQPPRKPAVPQIDGAKHPIDAFILQKLQEKGLQFSPQADDVTLRRRISFDLHGLPPGRDVLEGSYEEAVDRLLASRHYGERWGRHWLDAVRFGETDGGEHNNERHTAWKYRDYVIDALNKDKPYTDFIREQIAGDVLAPGDHNVTAATGFLVAGPWDSVTKRINRDETMRKTIRQDELDDMVTATFAAFQALTVNCARCHDHKFDPIPQKEYYRLTAVFHGAGFGERQLATEEERKAHAARLDPLKKELADVRRQLSTIEDPARVKLLTASYRKLDESRAKDDRLIPVNPVWNRNAFAPVPASRFRFVVTGHGGKQARISRLELLPAGKSIADWSSAEEATPEKPAILEITLDQPVVVSEIQWSSGTSSNEGAIKVYRFEFSRDGSAWETLSSSLDHVHPIEVQLPQVEETELEAVLPGEALAARAPLKKRQAELQAQIDAIPPLPSVHAVTDEPLTPAYLLERGSVASPKEEVNPGALSVIRTVQYGLTEDRVKNEGARRVALADWIASPKNPLTARVIVNRVWYHHFGNGLVNTPSDFGFNGDRPSHPELLDYLATEFMENGWSLKWLHRQILLSRTYRQSSAMNEKAYAVDAGNRLLWRMPLKRMDAETLRDTILAVTGKLDRSYGGESFRLHRISEKGYLLKALNNDGPEVWRRAVYRFVARGSERTFMDSFDCPDPAVFTPQRSISNTPVQALTLLNNKFVLRQAGFLAERLEQEAGAKPPDQVRHAYRLLFQRDPSPAEIDYALSFLQSESLAMYCRVLLNSNEFVYVP